MVYLDPRPAELEFVPVENLPERNPFFLKQFDSPLLKGVRRVGIVFPKRRIENVRG